MNSHSIADAQELAETLNCHLTGIELKLASVTPNGNSSLLEYLSLNLDYENYFVLKQTPDVAIVYSFLSELSQSKVTALAQISVRQLRECADLIAPSLCSWLHGCIVSGVLADDWKCSFKVIPYMNIVQSQLFMLWRMWWKE